MVEGGFLRARTQEQRESRREQILAATRALLQDRRVTRTSLNEIARRTGLAKSNVLRYFGSREAILLELAQRDYAAWVDEVTHELEDAGGGGDPVTELAVALATITRRPLLCELLGCSAAVLEHHVNVEDIIGYKTAMYGHIMRLVAVIESRLGPVPEPLHTVVVVGVHGIISELWAVTHPAPALMQAARRDGRLLPPQDNLEREMSQALAVLLAGVAAQSQLSN
ncbi:MULTISPECIES: TetR family transcriptional regulator [unclassified Actinomyces]|uniref:TetR family transcriptional regulator n=1 Tax=unclassified Actinomyces TaxID=2609248 RepID=UPI002017AB29|nr:MULTISPECIES: TetR family transcriptional regulator [unclassified Actinomyces]MCL3776900.1 TetR family transcriptional regulator [Actinomyces sp. AC-20-1]MCL3790321.1 TetR family transcriptional regulator [Actinomyces sp. 187325]MCL3792599.1 TetR family transcriptional regulator [Actinomyces sp. 186855]MCL3794208.1 TetR family transcriptional regulator [Actinomyces sp. 217892]